MLYGLHCPYCGESIEIVIDPSLDAEDYIEDCSVCCRPIELSVRVHADGFAEVRARTDTE